MAIYRRRLIPKWFEEWFSTYWFGYIPPSPRAVAWRAYKKGRRDERKLAVESLLWTHRSGHSKRLPR
jgi:hypothetical protein